MIKDNIKNANLYYNLSKRIEAGLKYLENTDFSTVECGKYEILGNEVYAIVQDYSSKSKCEGKFEAHRKYIDIQYVIKGAEQMGCSDVENFTDATDYSVEKDIVFLEPKTDFSQGFITVKEKEFVIFYPDDAHMPSIAIDRPSYVKKGVIKVQV